MQVALALYVCLLSIEFMLPHVSHDTHAELRILSRGALRVPFWASVILGNLLPFVLLFGETGWSVTAAAVLTLALAVVSDHVWVRAPQLISLR